MRSGRLLFVLLCLGTCLHTAFAQDPTPQHEQRAQEYLRARQPELARKEFEAVVAAQPENLNAQTNLGVLAYFAGDCTAAEPHLRAALQLDHSLSRQQALLGFCERRNGEFVTARSDLSAALPAIDDLRLKKQAGLELVELDTAANDLAAATVAVNQLKAALPTDPEVLYAAYRVYTDLAGEAMLDLSLAAPQSAQMHQAMAHELYRERDNAGAIQNLRTALQADPHLPGAHFELAELLAASSDPAQKAEAASQYQLALQDNPSDDKALTRLGDLAAGKGDHTLAEAQYRKALAVQPASLEPRIGLAHELVEGGHPEQALPLLEQVIKDDPTNLLAHYRLSALYRRLHRTEDSRREVATYEHLKADREKLRTLYESMRMKAPQRTDASE